jgi:hypothetical protein
VRRLALIAENKLGNIPFPQLPRASPKPGVLFLIISSSAFNLFTLSEFQFFSFSVFSLSAFPAPL